MTFRRQSVATLTRLDAALDQLCDGIGLIAPRDLPLAEALGCIAAEKLLDDRGWPLCDTAVADGWALRSIDIVGASAYSPVPLPGDPVWVEAGSTLPAGCDCVVEAERVAQTGSMLQAVAEAAPGEGVRRAGTDISAAATIAAGQRIGARDLAMAQTIGLTRLPVRRPRVHVLAIPTVDGQSTTAPLIVTLLRHQGADVVMTDVAARDIRPIADAISCATGERRCDLLLLIGGTGAGRTDATVAALGESGVVIAHGLAQRPGRSAALARVGTVPVVALPGTPSDALAAWYTVGQPVLGRLTGYRRRETQRLTLTRKIASTVGLAELTVLARSEAGWTPLASGDIPLEQWARADAWLRVSEESEGYAAGSVIEAQWLCDRA